MGGSVGIDERARDAAIAVGEALRDGLGRNLVAAYVHGSAVLGGFMPAVSDLDVLVVCREALRDAEVLRLRDALAGVVGRLPAKGLELSVLTAAEAGGAVGSRPRFQLHVAIGANGEERVVDGRTTDGDRDVVLHVAVCRERGWTLEGPAASSTLARVPADVALRSARDEIDWASAAATPEYLVLTAARALVLSATGHLVSKVEAAEWVLGTDGGPAVVRAALARQRGGADEVDVDAARAFARDVSRRIARESVAG